MDFAKNVSLWILDPVGTYRAERYSGVEYFTCRAFAGRYENYQYVGHAPAILHRNAISAHFLTFAYIREIVVRLEGERKRKLQRLKT